MIDYSYWVGFLEGSGSFIVDENLAGQLVVGSPDAEIIEELSKTLGKEKGSIRRKRLGAGYNYRWTINGYGAVSIMQKIYPYLTERRKRGVEEVFDYYEREKELYFCRHLGEEDIDAFQWLCGLLQAKGQISIDRVSLQSGNVELLEKILNAAQIGNIYGPYKSGDKQAYEFNVKKEKAAELARRVYPYLGKLRKQTIERYF